MAGRMTLCNMAIEMGGKAGIVAPDKITWEYMKGRRKMKPFELDSDEDAKFISKRIYNVSDLEPQVAFPTMWIPVSRSARLPEHTLTRSSSAHARTGGLRILRKQQKCWARRSSTRKSGSSSSRHPGTSTLKTLRAGLIEKFVKAGALVEAPCCGPCMGGAFGLIAPGEVSLSTSNRNFKGRQGSTEGKVYLCSPATAASAITGEITEGGITWQQRRRAVEDREGRASMRVWKFGDDIDTDAIIPGRFLTIYDPERTGKTCL